MLGQIGFRVHLIEGGYKAWRAALVASLDGLVPALQLRVLCGRTGSGKSRLLQALREEGADGHAAIVAPVAGAVRVPAIP